MTVVHVTLDDLDAAASELRETGTCEWEGEDGIKIILALVEECPHDSYRSVCVKCNAE